mmetsp:Transcript_98157/g.280979  ORF Transcript_98157/g.280979 Transcript_98157/m.280979 type:complete len:216 (-) Transcript_98157:365-1012(-)
MRAWRISVAAVAAAAVVLAVPSLASLPAHLVRAVARRAGHKVAARCLQNRRLTVRAGFDDRAITRHHLLEARLRSVVLLLPLCKRLTADAGVLLHATWHAYLLLARLAPDHASAVASPLAPRGLVLILFSGSGPYAREPRQEPAPPAGGRREEAAGGQSLGVVMGSSVTRKAASCTQANVVGLVCRPSSNTYLGVEVGRDDPAVGAVRRRARPQA